MICCSIPGLQFVLRQVAAKRDQAELLLGTELLTPK